MARLILVRAPAGFGKTTAMVQCLQRYEEQGSLTTWLTLDPADNDPARFLAYLAAAAAQLFPDDSEASARIRSAPDIGALAMTLIDPLEARFGKRWASRS